MQFYCLTSWNQNEEGIYAVTLLPTMVVLSSPTTLWEFSIEWLCWRLVIHQSRSIPDDNLWSI
jgi:hypothetical protein